MLASVALNLGKKLSSSQLQTLRKIIPTPIKQRLVRLVSNGAPVDQDVLTAADGHKFVAINEPVFVQVRLEGWYEKGLSDLARAAVRTGDTVADIGANFGWYTIMMAKEVGPQGKVYSIEPNSAINGTLERNIALNDYQQRVDLQKIGIGAESSTAKLSAGFSESAIGYVVSDPDPETEGELQEITLRSIDEVLGTDVGKVAFMKVDVEGFEPFVFLGGKKTFSSVDLPIIQLEFNVDALRRANADSQGFVDAINALPATIYEGQRGVMKLVDKLTLEHNADLFIFPKSGKFSDRLEGVVARSKDFS